MKSSKLTGNVLHLLLEFIFAGTLGLVTDGLAATIADNFNDGNDLAPPVAWGHYDPIGVGQWSFPDANTYRVQAASSPDPGNFGPGRSGSIASGNLTNFYLAVDVVNWDPTVHQVFGLLARIGTPGPGTTTGYLLNWDNGNPPTSTSGDMDIVRLDGESPTDLDGNTYFGNDSVHLETNHTYRFVFMGMGNTFRGQVFDLATPGVPIVDYGVTDPLYDPSGTTHVSGAVGVFVANNASAKDGPADATFDNFMATDGPLLDANFGLLSVQAPSLGTVTVS